VTETLNNKEKKMAKRHKMSKRNSRKVFRRGAKNIKKKNVAARPMRGGIRL
jgi:hypothetical protein